MSDRVPQVETPAVLRSRVKPLRQYLIEHLESVPSFRALLRCIEAEKIAAYGFPRPVLDLGCGDGIFAAMTFTEPLDAGVDPAAASLEEARATGMYRELELIDGRTLPYPEGRFASVVSNSVLEHIPDIDQSLREVARVLRPGGKFVFTTPSHHFAEYLFFPTLLRGLGLPGLARRYEDYFNRISRHYRTDAPEVWQARLERHGLRVSKTVSYFSPSASRAFDLLHYYSSPSILYKKLTGRWVIAPFPWNFFYLTPVLWNLARNPDCPEGAYLYIECEKVS